MNLTHDGKEYVAEFEPGSCEEDSFYRYYDEYLNEVTDQDIIFDLERAIDDERRMLDWLDSQIAKVDFLEKD